MNYLAFMNQNVNITLKTGEKLYGMLTQCSDKLEYITLDGDVKHKEKRIARSEISIITRAIV